MMHCVPLIQCIVLKFIIDTAKHVECSIDCLSIPPVSSENRARDYATSNPSSECGKTNTTIGCRLLAR